MSRSKAKDQQKAKEQVQGADKFTAVIFADTFTHDFKPITINTPRALIPIGNVPIIDYTIEFLVLNGVEEIFVLCATHADKLQQHITNSRWANCQEVIIKVLIAQCENPGEALRHLNDYDVLRQDFLLVSADVLSNYAGLKQLMKRHKARREMNPSILLTMVFREEEYFSEVDSAGHNLPPVQPTWAMSSGRPLIEEYVTAILEPETGILHSCQPWVSHKFSSTEDDDLADDTQQTKVLNVDLKLFKDYPTLQCRSDLIDTNIVFCSLELLSVFKQEFDFVDIKHDCVQSILEHYVLGNKVAADIIRAPFYGRVVSFNHYAAITQALLGRWLYPMVPEYDFSGRGNVNYTLQDNNLYLGYGAKHSRGVELGSDVLIGPHTVIESGAVIKNCSIGANCRIGKNSKIVNTCIWDNVHVGDGCTINSAIICTGVCIMNDVTVSTGSILAQNVKIGAGHTTIPNARVHIDGETDPMAVGKDGQGLVWTPVGAQMWVLDVRMREEADDDTDSLGSFFEELLVKDSETVSSRIYPKSNRVLLPHEEKMAPEQNFFMEMQQLIHRALRENHQNDNSNLEILALKFAYNRSFQDCARGTLRGFVTYFDDGNRSAKTFKEDMVRAMKEGWTSVFKKFVRSETDCDVQLEMLDELVELAKARKIVLQAFVHLLMFLHENDILQEKGILKWAENVEKYGKEEEKAIRSKCNAFIEWLQQEDEEDEEEEDDD